MNIMQIYKLVAGILAASLISVAAHAQMTPASLGDPAAEAYFGNLIVWPETHGDAKVKVQCQAVVKASGRIKESGCWIDNNWEPDFVAAITKASKKTQLIPAMDGKKGKNIGLLYQVEFLKVSDEKSINIYLNAPLPDNDEEYGENLISAQRVVGKERWVKACPKHAQWVIMAKAHVNDQGVPSSVNLEHGSGILPGVSCQQAIIDTILSSQFSPAYIDGVNVPSGFVEPFGN